MLPMIDFSPRGYRLMVTKQLPELQVTLSPDDTWKAGKRGTRVKRLLFCKTGNTLPPYISLVRTEDVSASSWKGGLDASLGPRDLCYHDRPRPTTNATWSKTESVWKVEREDVLGRQLPR